MLTAIHHLIHQLWLYLGSTVPAMLSQVVSASTIGQFLQALFISWVMQKWSERRKGNLPRNCHQVEGVPVHNRHQYHLKTLLLSANHQIAQLLTTVLVHHLLVQ